MIAGADDMLDGADSPLGGIVGEILVSVPVLAEKHLGLPRETSFDAERPFRDVPRTV